MGLISWWQNRKRKELQRTYHELSTEFFETYTRLKQLFYELKGVISKRLSIEEVFAKRNQFYETYKQFTHLLEELTSIDERWGKVESKIGFFSRGVTYLFKHENNFDYDKALKTLNIMKKSFKKIEDSLNELNSKAA